MRVVLDTNILVSDFMLQGTEFRTLFSESPGLGYALCIPQVVVDETVNKFSEEMERLYKEARRLGVLGMIFPEVSATTITSAEAAREAYQTYLDRLLQREGMQIVGYPSVSHKDLVDRALARRKPFRGTDTGGYRDALIWQTVLELAEEDDVCLITNNVKDFADQGGKELHQDLKADIGLRHLREVTLFDSAKRFNEEMVYPRLKLLDDIKERLKNNNYEQLSLPKLIEEQLPEYLGFQELDPSAIDLPDEFEALYIDFVEETHQVSEIGVKRLSSGELLITFSADVDSVLSFLISKDNYYSRLYAEPDDYWEEYTDILALATDWNEWYVSASTTKRVVLDLKLTFAPERGEITSLAISEIRAA